MIDVSKCDFYDNCECKCYLDESECCEGYYPSKDLCNSHPNCYYKQLKHENEELKAKLKQADEDIKEECTRCALVNLLGNKLEDIEHLISQSDFTQCQRCDGVGLPDCADTDCSTYILHKIREVVDEAHS